MFSNGNIKEQYSAGNNVKERECYFDQFASGFLDRISFSILFSSLSSRSSLFAKGRLTVVWLVGI